MLYDGQWSMTDDASKTVLLAFVGNVPAVLTELVWELVSSGTRLDEICLFGAHATLNRVRSCIFDGGKESLWAEMTSALRRRRRLPKGCAIPDPQYIPFVDKNGCEVDKEVDPSDLDAVSNQLLHFIRARKSGGRSDKMIISISGERKCTSAQLQTAAALAADESDRLIHVLISDDFAFVKDFYYPAQKKRMLAGRGQDGEERTLDATQARLTIIDIPFVPIGGLLTVPGALEGSFHDIVAHARERIAHKHKVVFHTKTQEIFVDGVEIAQPGERSKNKMQPRAYFYLALHALKTKLGLPSIQNIPAKPEIFQRKGFGFLMEPPYLNYYNVWKEWSSIGVNASIPVEINRGKDEAKKRLEEALGEENVPSIFVFSSKLTERYADGVYIDVLP